MATFEMETAFDGVPEQLIPYLQQAQWFNLSKWINQVDGETRKATAERYLREYSIEVLDTTGSNIDYTDDNNRKYYIMRYSTPHVQVIFELLEDAYNEKEMYRNWCQNRQRNTKIVSVGGGPGTEIIALLAHFHSQKKFVPELCSATVLDIVTQWREEFADLNIDGIACNYERFDITAPFRRCVKSTICEADIVTMSKIMSEIMKVGDPMRVVIRQLKEVLSLMKPGSLLLFMDTNCPGKYSRPIEYATGDCQLEMIFEFNRELPNFKAFPFHGVDVKSEIKVHMMLFLKN